MKYLIVGCQELEDQFECDADRIPMCLTENYLKYNRYGFEIYEVRNNGTFRLIKHYYDKKVKKNEN